ncbi:hypothetical protein BZA77DRAFT_19513 [Pyronema omphalodes]|nr:hypothetical protein BZA77DRAFT_19513 [Pyronema omphalodes]
MSSQSPRIGQTVTPKTSPQLVQRGFGSSAAQGKPLPQKPLPRTPTTLASPPESPRKNRKDGYTPASIAHTEEESEGEEEEAEEEQESLTNSEESSTNCEDSDSTEQDPLNRTNSSQQATSAIPQPTHTLKNSGNQVVNRVMVLTAALSKRTEEIRMIRQLAEQKVQETMERIKELELRAEGVEVLKSHTHNANLELDVLKLKLKKLETMAFEFVPLSEQHLLLDFEEYKEQLLKAQTKQKQRRKKEDERWKLWGERVVDGKGVVRDSERHGGWKGN